MINGVVFVLRCMRWARCLRGDELLDTLGAASYDNVSAEAPTPLHKIRDRVKDAKATAMVPSKLEREIATQATQAKTGWLGCTLHILALGA